MTIESGPKYPGVQGEIRQRGRRLMILENKPNADGTSTGMLVPQTLLPLESNLLAVIDYLHTNDDRQTEVDGYSLIRQIDPNISSQYGFGTFYRALGRLSKWGYLTSRTELLPMGNQDSGRATVKRLYRITNAGQKRLETSLIPGDPYRRLLEAIEKQK